MNPKQAIRAVSKAKARAKFAYKISLYICYNKVKAGLTEPLKIKILNHE